MSNDAIVRSNHCAQNALNLLDHKLTTLNFSWQFARKHEVVKETCINLHQSTTAAAFVENICAHRLCDNTGNGKKSEWQSY